MPAFQSAGVYYREIDLSLYAPALATTIFGVVGGAHKGPKNTPTFIGSVAEYIRVFGNPTTNMGRTAIQYLRFGRQLVVVRVANSDVAATANLLDGSSNDAVGITAKETGEYGNDISVEITDSVMYSGKKMLIIRYRGLSVEKWDNLAGGGGEIVTLLNAESQYVSATDLGNDPVNQVLPLLSGDSGISGLIDADYIGTADPYGTGTGLQSMANSETIDLNLIAVPGNSASAVVTALISFAETRGDCLALIDPPYGLDVQGVINWHNGDGYGHSALNSSHAALYWSWHQIYDPYAKEAVWVPPCGPTAAIMAYTDFTAETWFAPAGMIRGKVQNSLDIEFSPSQGQRDFLQGPGTNVNPYVNFSKEGIVLWGQKTLQRQPTALDRVNVRRLLLWLEKVIVTAARSLVFEPNDEVTWRRFVSLCESAIEPVQARRGLYDFRVICDDTTNLPETIDQNRMIGKILLKPTKTAEILEIDFTILSTGAEFTEYV